ncbi:hypothetical protein EAG_06340 [Camponotus floridanus]|uniref:Uncharacterized protein n=1 Tax=Camponotus floridanus TaxID=104421 RepID=E1ZVE1_CAMFO|nr:hypothetical protein EAG_06340 [Camponotus floridanus]
MLHSMQGANALAAGAQRVVAETRAWNTGTSTACDAKAPNGSARGTKKIDRPYITREQRIKEELEKEAEVSRECGNLN